jgi:hypothetical protein
MAGDDHHLNPAALATQINASYEQFLTRQGRAMSPHRYVYASSWRACARRMVYDCRQPDQLPPWPAETLAKFRRGDDRERDLLADLVRVGRDAEPPFAVVNQQQRFELRDHKSRVAIVGKVDARLAIDGRHPPLEVKAWAPTLVERIETFEDLCTNPWTRGGSFQLLAYLLATSEPFGFLLLDRSGLPRLLPVELTDANLDRMETFLATAETVLDHVDRGTLPDYYDDPSECRRCPWYGHTCNPPLAAQAAQILTDPELEAALERRHALRTVGEEYNALDRQVKDRLRGIESGIIGHFHIAGRWGKQSRVELPDALKQQYTVTDPHGRFTLEIARSEAS